MSQLEDLLGTLVGEVQDCDTPSWRLCVGIGLFVVQIEVHQDAAVRTIHLDTSAVRRLRILLSQAQQVVTMQVRVVREAAQEEREQGEER